MSIRSTVANTLYRPLVARLDRIEHEVGQTRALAARAYEAAQRWPEILEEVRAEPDYGTPFAGDPLVTVRIATYNGAQLLCERTLPSVLRQTYPRWEAVVVGDACTDDTEARVKALADERIRFVNLPFRGPYPAERFARWRVAGTGPMNAAMDLAQGDWIASLDHDDEFEDDHIEVLLRAAQAARAELAYGELRVRRADTGELQPLVIGAWPPRHGSFMFQAALVHRAVARFKYDLNAHLTDEPGDWNLARRLWECGVRFTFVDAPVGTYWDAGQGPRGLLSHDGRGGRRNRIRRLTGRV